MLTQPKPLLVVEHEPDGEGPNAFVVVAFDEGHAEAALLSESIRVGNTVADELIAAAMKSGVSDDLLRRALMAMADAGFRAGRRYERNHANGDERD